MDMMKYVYFKEHNKKRNEVFYNQMSGYTFKSSHFICNFVHSFRCKIFVIFDFFPPCLGCLPFALIGMVFLSLCFGKGFICTGYIN